MNKLKYRLWDNEKECLLGPYTLPELPSEFLCMSPQDFDRRYEVMAQIGKKDRDEREIYEGDIISVRYFDGWFDDKGEYINSLVYFNDKRSAFVFAVNPEESMGFLFDTPDFDAERNYKIVGNVYENPELLNNDV